jgi:phage-related tail fiber protein
MAQFKTIHTTYGLGRMASAEATGTPINLVAVAVGDGNGNPTTPDPAQTQLVREVYRHAPNRVYQDPTNPLLFTVEMLIPYSVGGFTIREIGVFDDNGSLFAVANVPNVYKPQGDGSEGSYGDTAIRMQFLVSNASVVTLQVDPAVAYATQQWVLNAITLPYLLPGGTTGQLLAKASNANGDVHWIDPTSASIVVSVLEETQTLAASQTAVTLSVCTNIGLAVYIEGIRLRPDQWTPNATDHTKLTLATSYPDGTKVDFVQNEPAAFVPMPLLQSNNLSDVANPSAARTNIGVDSKVNTDTHAPPSEIAYFARNTAPSGWMKANGAAVSRTAYAALFAAIGTTFGAGDGFNTFNLPDLRGEFIRGWDDGRGVDAGRALGSAQGDAIRNITGTMGMAASGFFDGGNGAFALATTTNGQSAPGTSNGMTDDFTFDASRVVPTANENRPRNIALLACIKF